MPDFEYWTAWIGWLNNKYWQLVLTVWLQFAIHFNYSLLAIKMLTVGPPKKETKTERNKWTNANQDPEKRNPHFSLTVEVKREDEVCLQGLRCWLYHAKSLLGIDLKTSSMQNADLLEWLLNCFELVMPSAVNLGPSPAASTSSMPHKIQPPPKSSLELEQEHQQPAWRLQRRQIYVDATVEDPFFVCTGESLKSLVKYFTRNLQCEFCGGDY